MKWSEIVRNGMKHFLFCMKKYETMWNKIIQKEYFDCFLTNMASSNDLPSSIYQDEDPDVSLMPLESLEGDIQTLFSSNCVTPEVVQIFCTTLRMALAWEMLVSWTRAPYLNEQTLGPLAPLQLLHFKEKVGLQHLRSCCKDLLANNAGLNQSFQSLLIYWNHVIFELEILD